MKKASKNRDNHELHIEFLTPVPYVPFKGDLVIVSLEQLVSVQKELETLKLQNKLKKDL